MHIGTFLFGTVIASGAATEVALVSGVSMLGALGFGALTAFSAQMLYLILITALAAREADARRDARNDIHTGAPADRKSVGTAQP